MHRKEQSMIPIVSITDLINGVIAAAIAGLITKLYKTLVF